MVFQTIVLILILQSGMGGKSTPPTMAYTFEMIDRSNTSDNFFLKTKMYANKNRAPLPLNLGVGLGNVMERLDHINQKTKNIKESPFVSKRH